MLNDPKLVQTVLVTGGTGFIGSHIVSQLLEKGYKVKGTTRTASKLRSIFPSAPVHRLEIIEMSTYLMDHTDVLKGVDALIHCGSPTVFHGETVQDLLDGTYHGTIKLVETAIKLGIKKIIFTSTLVTLLKSDLSDGYETNTIGPGSWCDFPLEGLSHNEPNMVLVYQVVKTATEKKLWEIADKHPELDLTTIVPVMTWGPFVPNYETALTSSPGSLSTSLLLQTLLNCKSLSAELGGPGSTFGHLTDVRDVARAHVLALSAIPLPGGEHKRLILPYLTFKWDNVIKVLRQRCFDDEKVLSRLPEGSITVRQMGAPLDTSLVAKTIELDSHVPFEDLVIETYQTIVLWEKLFKA